MPFRVALTFDAEHPDRPAEAGATEAILDALGQAGVRATFFLQGRWVEAYPRVAREIVAAGHVVGSHSHYHARLPMLSPRGVTTDLASAAAAIRRVAGVDPRPWFRCPFGNGMRDRRLMARLASLGYRNVGWDVDGRDWALRRPGTLAERVVSLVSAHGDGCVVLLHGWPSVTPRALPSIVERLRAGGATFVGIDDLPALPAGFPGDADPLAEAAPA